MTAAALEQVLMTVLGLAAAVLAFFGARRSRRAAVIAALVVLCLVPIWAGVGLGFNGGLFLPFATASVLAVSLALLPIRGMRFSLVDAFLLAMVVFSASSLVTSDTSLALSFLITPFTAFVGGYLFGRLTTARFGAAWVHGAIAVAFTAVAALAITEFVTGWNPFVGWTAGNSLFAEWGSLQERGGIVRAEGAFGHSIALGASLALAVPLALAAGFPVVVRLAMVALLSVGTVLTFSRVSIVCLFLGLALSVVVLRRQLDRGLRLAVVAVGAVCAVALSPLIVAVFGAAGEEAADSAGYRADLIPLLESANLVGFSDEVSQSARGLAFGEFRSIDSQLILTALSSGILSLAAACLALGAAIWLCLAGRAQPATVALVAHIPAIATVALITQYSVILWLVVGIAATSQLAHRAPATIAGSPLPFPLHPIPGGLHDTSTLLPRRR